MYISAVLLIYANGIASPNIRVCISETLVEIRILNFYKLCFYMLVFSFLTYFFNWYFHFSIKKNQKKSKKNHANWFIIDIQSLPWKGCVYYFVKKGSLFCYTNMSVPVKMGSLLWYTNMSVPVKNGSLLWYTNMSVPVKNGSLLCYTNMSVSFPDFLHFLSSCFYWYVLPGSASPNQAVRLEEA